MFLKRVAVSKNGKRHTYWALVESYRTRRGPRHRTVAYLGELTASEKKGWAKVKRFLERIPEPGRDLFGTSEEKVPKHVQVNVRDVRVEGTRDFGDVYLGLTLWRALRLDELLKERLPPNREGSRWDHVAAILALARFCEPSSELHIADTWYLRTVLDELLAMPVDQVNKDRLYRGLDKVLSHKEAIEKHLREQFVTLFDASLDLILYDVTSTYFEGLAQKNPQAKRGHSRDSRGDCVQVCIGLVVTREGLPLAYEVFDGNRNDVTTLEEIVRAMERKHGKMNRIWVLDRGIASEQNLKFFRKRKAFYIVGTPRSQLRRFERALLEKGWKEVQPGVQVKLCPGPDGQETFVLCRSQERRQKEQAMVERFTERIEKGLKKLSGRLSRARKLLDRSEVDRQIGRMLERNQRAAKLFTIKLREQGRGKNKRLRLWWRKRQKQSEWMRRSQGHYLLRTNLNDWKVEDLWKSYIQLTQAEWGFRIEKTELKIRPIWHQLEERVQAHILFSFLAYAMWKTLEMWMVRSGLGNGPRTVLEEMAKLKAVDVFLPTSTGRELHLRCVTKPDQGQRILLQRLGLKIPQRLGEPRWRKRLPKM